MDFVNLLHDFTGSADIAHAKARHGIGLGEAVHGEGSFLHARQRCKAGMGAFIGEITVDFIGNHHQVMLLGKVGDFYQRLSVHDGAGGVIGVANKDSLGPGSHFLFQFFHSEFEFIFSPGRHQHRFAPGNGYAGRIGQVSRIRNKYFVFRIEEGGHDDADGLRNAYGHHDFIHRIIIHMVSVMEKFCNFLAQREKTPVGRIGGFFPFQAFHAGINHLIRRRIVRFPYTQGNHVLHRAGQVKKFTNTGKRHRFNIGCHFFIPIHSI